MNAPAVTPALPAIPPRPLGTILPAALVAILGGFLFGYDTAVINGANSYLKAWLHLSPAEEGLAGASAILGCIPGAFAAGFLSDRFGRKRLLIVCALLFALSGLLCAIPQSFLQFLGARFLGGLGIGASSMACPVYIAEIAPSKWRGRLGTLFQLGIVLGIFLTLYANRLIQGFGDEAWNTTTGWRWMLGTEAVPAVLFFIVILWAVESPRWLARKGRNEEAKAILSRIFGSAGAEEEQAAIAASLAHEEGSLSEIFTGPYRKPLLIAAALMVFQQFCGINAIMYYSTKIFAAAGGGQNAAFTASAWIGLVNVVFTFVAIAFVDRSGRRPLLLIGLAVQVVALALVGWMFSAQRSGLPLLLCIVAFVGAFAMALGPVCWLFCSEVFPNKVRGRAMSFAVLTVWVACFIVAQTFPMLNDNPLIGPAKTFALYAFFSLAGLVFVARFVPETKGRTLEEIETLWQPKA